MEREREREREREKGEQLSKGREQGFTQPGPNHKRFNDDSNSELTCSAMHAHFGGLGHRGGGVRDHSS